MMRVAETIRLFQYSQTGEGYRDLSDISLQTIIRIEILRNEKTDTRRGNTQ